MRTKLFAGVAIAALVIPGAAFAQSTASQDFEDEIVVTGAAATDVGGVEIPDTPKAKVQLDRDLLLRQRPGQTVNDMLNLVPGVSFTNNDPWGSLGGSFSIRGFDSSRISQTVDGIPLNDSGNYALYTNQQPDPETLEAVSVNLGSTDVDSPTASAVGGTINMRTREPSDTFGVMASVSYGDLIARGQPDSRPYNREFIMLDSGDLTGHGTKFFLSASKADNESVFSNYGGVDKQQYNGRLYQAIGGDGDFVSIAFNYNENRNNFNGSPLRANAFTGDIDGRFYEIDYPCNVDTPTPGVADMPNSCGTEFERRFNPSNTGNVRVASRFTLADGLVLSVEPSFQYVKANGGGTGTAVEGFYNGTTTGAIYSVSPVSGDRDTFYYVGNVDLNGDGEIGDEVSVLDPSNTQTRRYGVIANLAYDLNDDNRVRISYTLDHARHRQTGYLGYLTIGGAPVDVFPVNDPIVDDNGQPVQKRNRLSYAILNQVSGEYIGKFMDQSLIVQLGLRAPFFTRKLDQRCVTTSPAGYVDCVNGDAAVAAYLTAHPDYAAPQERTYDYDKLLPNVGFTYNFTPAFSLAASYAKNLSVPGTDTLYNSLYLNESNAAAKPTPETSDSFDLGLRYKTGSVQAMVTGWYTNYTNRISSAYDLDCDCTIQTNLGPVEKYGVDASISYRPVRQLLVYAFGSYIGSRIKNDAVSGVTCAPYASAYCYEQGGNAYYTTSGNREAAAPKWLVGGRIQGTFGPLEVGAQAKYTGPRYLNDINTFRFGGYTLVDLDVRYSLADAGLENTYFQLNLTNLFDKFYVGSFSGGLDTFEGSSSAYVNYGSPRAISASMIVAF